MRPRTLHMCNPLRAKQAVCIACMLTMALCANAAAQYSGGTGDPNTPFQLSTVTDWQALMTTPTDWSVHFTLTADLDLTDIPLTPIGNDPNNFTGAFNGNNHTISNADINTPGENHVGLFGYLADGQISNLGVENVLVNGASSVGGLLGYNTRGTITNCHASGSVSAYYRMAGGLVGRNVEGAITNCYATGSVIADDWVGGLVGYNSGSVSDCRADGTVTGDSGVVGGLIGGNTKISTTTNCYATGPVSGREDVGGLVGANGGGVTNCYAAGSVTANDRNAGGLVGRPGA